MRKDRSLRGFVLGMIVGMMVGSASLAVAAFGYKGWVRFSNDFKTGYVTGFMDMANLARNLEPGGWVDVKYPQIPNAKPLDYHKMVDELYAMPENQKYTITSIMQSATHKMQEKYGKPISPDERVRQRMLAQLEAAKKRREAQGKPPLKEDPKIATAPEKTVSAAKADPTPKKKWCRCDGKDPKAEREKRRAAQAEQDRKDEEELMEAAKAAKAADPKAAAPAANDAAPAAQPNAAK